MYCTPSEEIMITIAPNQTKVTEERVVTQLNLLILCCCVMILALLSLQFWRSVLGEPVYDEYFHGLGWI